MVKMIPSCHLGESFGGHGEGNSSTLLCLVPRWAIPLPHVCCVIDSVVRA